MAMQYVVICIFSSRNDKIIPEKKLLSTSLELFIYFDKNTTFLK